MMTFSKALEVLKDGGLVTRAGWHKEGMYLALQKPDEHSKMSQPYIYITIYADLDNIERVPWLASQTDLLSDDWAEIAED